MLEKFENKAMGPQLKDDEVLTLPELMKRLRCCESTLRKMIRNGLPKFKVGNEYRFHYKRVMDYLESK